LKKLIRVTRSKTTSREKRGITFRYPVTTLVGGSPWNFIRVCRGFVIDKKFYLKTILSYLISVILGIFVLWEKIIWHKRIRMKGINEPPVFIIGYWRSGTTLLHNLLCLDDRAGYTTTFQTVFPHLVLGHKWLKKLTNRFLPPGRPFDSYAWSMDTPQEEEFAMFNLQPVTFYKFFLFPKDFEKILQTEFYYDDLDPVSREEWKREYTELIRKALLNTHGTRFISKNPCNLGRIAVLQKMFPGAKFIFIHRDPYKVTESLYGFFHSILPGIQLQTPEGIPARKHITDLYCRIMRRYFREKAMIAPANLVELSYEDLVKDIPGMIRKIYDKFGLEGFDRVTEKIRLYSLSNDVTQRKPLAIAEETCRLLNQDARDIFETLGYPVREFQPAVKVTG
jgi:hypothetical protein